jgi:hypothetical protein
LELCCRRGEMLLIQNKRVNWETCQIGIPGATAKDKENLRIPFNPHGRVSAILKRRADLGRDAFVFGSATGTHQPNIQTARGRRGDCSLTDLNRAQERMAWNGTGSRCSRSISDGTTCGTKVPAGCLRTVSTSESSS